MIGKNIVSIQQYKMIQNSVLENLSKQTSLDTLVEGKKGIQGSVISPTVGPLEYSSEYLHA